MPFVNENIFSYGLKSYCCEEIFNGDVFEGELELVKDDYYDNWVNSQIWPFWMYMFEPKFKYKVNGKEFGKFKVHTI